MKILQLLLFFLACLSLQGQTPAAEPPKSWSPEPLEDSVKKYRKKGDFARSLSFADQWIEKTRQQPGKDSLDYAAARFYKGDALVNSGKYEGAMPNLNKSLEIRKISLGETHPDVASSYNNLGVLHLNMGNFLQAEFYFQKALEIRKVVLSENHPYLAATYNNLGALYGYRSSYLQAEPYFQKTLEIRKKVLGENHPEVAASYDNLGGLFLKMGSYPGAEPYFQKAFEIRKKVQGENHPDVATSCNNLGVLYVDMGNYSQAEPYFQKALEIRKKAQGENHPDVANSYNNLGVLNVEMGNYNKAEPYYQKALEIRKKAHGENHPDVATSYHNLGSLYLKMGNYTRSQPFFQKALEIRKKAQGENHPDLADNYNILGVLFFNKSEFSMADGYFEKESLLDKSLLTRYFPSLSEKEREAYLKLNTSHRKVVQSFHVAAGRQMPQLRGELYNHQLFFKGLLLNTSARWKQRIKTSGDKKLVQKFFDWEMYQTKISSLFTSTDSSERAGLDSLLQMAEKLEKELSQRSENFARGEDRKARTWKDVQQSLKIGEAAIEMVRIQKYGIARIITDTSDPRKPTYRLKGLTDTLRYAALILTKTCTQPEMVLLENGNDLEGKWFSYYRNSIRLQEKDAISYKQFWEPFARKLKGIKKVWFSADGVYHKINLNTLKNPATGKFLSEEMDISLLGSTKDLLKVYPDESENRLACLLGNPEFQPGQAAQAGKSRSGPELSYYFQPNPNLEISALPGTQTEVDSIAYLLQQKGWEVQQFAGSAASEDKIKDSYKPRVMLLSTHGFFRPDTTPGNNPLIRSGLLLSGAAKTLREGRSGDVMEDGILTAYEAMNLNLDNTELVVLSACETGLGEIRNGEGVYGLQRAFQVAGARNLIMSLWKVDDAVTQKLMTSFFRHWLNGKSKQAAFAQAQKEIRAQHPEPYYWGGFVMMGK